LPINRPDAPDQFAPCALANYEKYKGQQPRVTFNGEAGIDMGDLIREFITAICDPLLKRALVLTGADDILWLPPNEVYDQNHVNDLIAIGLLLRLAIQTERR
jgi:hypothetical protein